MIRISKVFKLVGIKLFARGERQVVYFSILSFILIIAAIWFFAYKKSRAVDNTSSEGYFLGGRSLTAVTIAGSIIMTNLSTEQLLRTTEQHH